MALGTLEDEKRPDCGRGENMGQTALSTRRSKEACFREALLPPWDRVVSPHVFADLFSEQRRMALPPPSKMKSGTRLWAEREHEDRPLCPRGARKKRAFAKPCCRLGA